MSTTMKVKYVWEVPVRIFHWVNAFCIVLLAGTGYVMGDPPALLSSQEAYHQYWFGTLRFLHFATAYLFTFNLLYRMYWGFVGNEYARLEGFIPYTKQRLYDIWIVIKVDILQRTEEEPGLEHSVGHNALAAAMYIVLFGVSFAMIFTGFAMLDPMSDSAIAAFFGTIGSWFGNDMTMRFWHHFLMWFFLLFIIVHVYLVSYHDYVEGRGVLSSIVGGWKFVHEDESK